MKLSKQIIIATLIILSIVIGCEKRAKTTKEYNNWFSETNNPSVELNIEEFKTYRELALRIESLFCNDSIPRLVFESKKSIKKVDVLTICPDVLAHPKSRNTIYFINGDLFKNEKNYPLDSLGKILRKDFFNYGEDSDYAENQEKILIIIENQADSKIEIVVNTLDKVTDKYDLIGTKEDLKIVVLLFTAPPPLPAEINFRG